MPVTVAETIDALEADGWRQVVQKENLRQFRHDSKAGTVTLAGKDELRIPPGVLRSLLRFAQLQEGT